ncbi:MAG: ABC transporter permease [Fuerstiella sp.]
MTNSSSDSRALRKFLRHKPAVVASFIIAAYAVVAMLLLFTNMITMDDTLQRVGPETIPGFSSVQNPEKRLEDAEWLLDRIDTLAGREDPRAALDSFRDLGVRHVAEIPIEDLQQRVEEGWEIYDRLAEVEDLTAAVNGTLNSPDAPTGEVVLADLQQLELKLDELLAPMTAKEKSTRWFEMLFGTDRQGRSIFYRSVYSIRVAVLVGLITGLLSVTIGTIAGLLSGYFGGWVDNLITWLYSTFASIPNIVLLILLAFMFDGGHIDEPLNRWTGGLLKWLIGGRLDETLIPVYIAFTATFWIGPCRVIRGETLKIRELEYVQAATVMGFGRTRILLRHILPNVTYLMLINFSLLFIGAIKSEVILSFLGLGVKKGPSWGIMISQSKVEVINGFFWQIGTATVLMFFLVLAFNVLSDALQDVLDPKHV